MKQENLLKKYGITREQYKKVALEITKIMSNKITNVDVHLAIIDLLATGDIEE